MALGHSRSACQLEQLQSLVQLVYNAKDVQGDILEIGSYKCGTTIVLAVQAQECSPEKKIYAFDTFSGRPQGHAVDPNIIPPFETNFQEVVSATKGVPSIHLVQGLHEETIPTFAHRPISVLFLDSDLYESHRVALEHFWPDISKGGFLVLHDFATLNCPGVRKAFDEFFRDIIDTLAYKHIYLSGMLVIQKD